MNVGGGTVQLFEESVTRIAEAVSAYLDREELAASVMFPHYFEKQQLPRRSA